MKSLLARLDALLPPPVPKTDWQARAYRWRKRVNVLGQQCFLEPVHHVAQNRLDELQHIDRQKHLIVQNTRQFIARLPANNVLLTGARGTGKSSLIKACLNEFAPQGLRLIEVDKSNLSDLPDIVDLVAARPERFIIFCDDLSFEEGQFDYKALKVALDGSVSATTDNVLIYATSNRRHLLPESMRDNDPNNDALHPGEVVEEKISLSERFGLWVSFYPFAQQNYLDIVAYWLNTYQFRLDEDARTAALQFALERGSRSGRVAWQFAKDWVGKNSLPSHQP